MASDLQLPPKKLLELLSDGQVHSGQELASLLGVSRTAVWKQLSKLEVLGLELQSKAGQGYCLNGGLELLDSGVIASFLTPEASNLLSGLELLMLIDSTNAYLLQKDSGEKISACMAECQTAGRGRRGRTWVSPFARNIYLSLRMTLETGMGSIEGLSLAIGVGIARALTALGASNIQLKWPNDVLWCGRKLGGVLIDVVGDPAGRCHLVVGIGLNINADKAMQAAIDQPWVSFAEVVGKTPQRNQVAATLLNSIVPLLADYEDKGFAHYHRDWEQFNAHAGRLVDLHLGANIVTGTLRGVSSSGALLLVTDKGEQIFHGGEVSLRIAE